MVSIPFSARLFGCLVVSVASAPVVATLGIVFSF